MSFEYILKLVVNSTRMDRIYNKFQVSLLGITEIVNNIAEADFISWANCFFRYLFIIYKNSIAAAAVIDHHIFRINDELGVLSGYIDIIYCYVGFLTGSADCQRAGRSGNV